MKTDLTLTIENALRAYSPSVLGGIKTNPFRGRHIAFEVPVECGSTRFGLVDAVEVFEYFGDIEYRNCCRWPVYKRSGIRGKDFPHDCALGVPPGQEPEECEHTRCRDNHQIKRGVPKILVVCFEIKITKADFGSKNGHNFVGNLNYYVVPRELYPQIKDLVPEGVGVILYLDGSQAKKTEFMSYPFVGLYCAVLKDGREDAPVKVRLNGTCTDWVQNYAGEENIGKVE